MFIRNDQRGLLFEDGNYVKCLKPGNHRFSPFKNLTYKIMDLNAPFEPGVKLNLLTGDKELISELDLLDVKDNELVLHIKDENLYQVLTPGRYAFWKVLTRNEFISVDLNDPFVASSINPGLMTHAALTPYLQKGEIFEYEEGILLIDGRFDRILLPGKYYFWKGFKGVHILKVELRRQELEISGQEVMTEDKVSLRLNCVCEFKVTDIRKVLLEVKDYNKSLYTALQLLLREYVGTLKLDDLLRNKSSMGAFLLEKLKEEPPVGGVEFLSLGVKDVILPGDVREILNTVLIAEKRAQANIITRREETASTRSLLNTAKLMDENRTLLRLKEMEFLEKVCDKINHISLSGGNSLIENLKELFSPRGQE